MGIEETYAAIKETLDDELDPYPEWEWHHEKRVLYTGEYANVPYQHKPDAHVVFRGHTFILERQTAESKVGPKKIYKKVEDHKRYVELKLRAPAEVLFAFDAHGSHLVDTAIRAGEQHDIRWWRVMSPRLPTTSITAPLGSTREERTSFR